MIVLDSLLQLTVDSEIEVDELVEILRKGTFHPVPSTIPKGSEYDEPKDDFNNPRLEVFSSKITLCLMMIYCLTRSNSR